MRCERDTSGVMAWIYPLFSARTFSQASSCSGGGAARAAEIPARGNCSVPRGVLVWPIRHWPHRAGIHCSSKQGWEQLLPLRGWIKGKTVPQQVPIPVTVEVYSSWWKWICVCCPIKQKAFLQLRLSILFICSNFVVLWHGHACHEGKNHRMNGGSDISSRIEQWHRTRIFHNIFSSPDFTDIF